MSEKNVSYDGFVDNYVVYPFALTDKEIMSLAIDDMIHYPYSRRLITYWKLRSDERDGSMDSRKG